MLVDERDPGERPRVLFYLEHAIQDATTTRSGEPRTISRRLLYVEIDPAGPAGETGAARHLLYAPYLDYRPLAEGDPALDALLDRPECAWITRDLEGQALGHAIAHVVKLAPTLSREASIVVGLSGRGDKDVDALRTRGARPERG